MAMKRSARSFASASGDTSATTDTIMLRGRIAKCLGYLETLSAKDFEHTKADQPVKLPDRPDRPGKTLRAEEYLVGRQIPNFYFHATTAYDIIRQCGVEVGKRDFMGSPPA